MIWGRPQLRILLVCTANVCRSPLAQALLQAQLRSAGLGRRVGVGSAGTRVAAPGRRPDPRVLRMLREAGVPAGRIRARQLSLRLLARQDLVLVMEAAHLGEVEGILGPDGPVVDLRLLGEFLPAGASDNSNQLPVMSFTGLSASAAQARGMPATEQASVMARAV